MQPVIIRFCSTVNTLFQASVFFSCHFPLIYFIEAYFRFLDSAMAPRFSALDLSNIFVVCLSLSELSPYSRRALSHCLLQIPLENIGSVKCMAQRSRSKSTFPAVNYVIIFYLRGTRWLVTAEREGVRGGSGQDLRVRGSQYFAVGQRSDCVNLAIGCMVLSSGTHRTRRISIVCRAGSLYSYLTSESGWAGS